ncbi:MAG: hypothetical protein QM541_11515 [Flavobacterium sp.]|nr:hypothetical protein [Flavobacterium sp.]
MSNQTIRQPFDISALVLKDIIIVQAGINNSKSISSVEGNSINLDIGMEAAFNVGSKMIRLTFKCDLSSSAHTELQGSFEIAFYFVVDEFEKLINVDEKEKKVNMEDDFLLSIANITYSTSRGIIYSRCLGTVFNKVIIPVVSNDSIKKVILNTG